MKNKSARVLVVGLLVLVLLLIGGIGLKRHQREKHLAELKARKNMDGLVAWWPADGDATDVISGETAILENKTRFGPGVAGRAFDFTLGSPATLSDKITLAWNWVLHFVRVAPRAKPFPLYKHVRIADRPGLRLTTGMTLEAWIYPVARGGYLEVIGKWSAIYPDPNPQASYTFGPVPDGRVYVGVSPVANGKGSQSAFSTSVLPLNVWSHVAGMYDGSALNIYVNGQLENSFAYDGGIYPATADVGIGAVVGNAAPGQSFSPFFGRIGDVSVYNRALTPAEVKAEFEGKAPSVPPPSSRE